MNKSRNIIDILFLAVLVTAPLWMVNVFFGRALFLRRDEYQIVFQLVTMVLLALSQPNKWVGCFFICAVLQYFVFGLKNYSSDVITMLFAAQVWMFLCYRYLTSLKMFLKWSMGLSAVIVAFSVIAHPAGLLPVTVFGQPIAELILNEKVLISRGYPGITAISNIAGAYLAITLPVFFVYWRGWLSFIAAGLLITQGNWAIISLACGYLVWFAFDKEKFRGKQFTGILIAGVSGCLVYCKMRPPSITQRWEVIEFMFSRMGGWQTFTGYGAGTFKKLGLCYEKAAGTWMITAHNEYAQCWFEFGLIGLGIILCALAFLGLRFFRHRRSVNNKVDKDILVLLTMLVVFLVNSVANFTFHHSLLGVLGLSLFVAADKFIKNKEVGYDDGIS